MNNEQQQVIALSVILQAISNLKELAFSGSYDRASVNVVLKGLTQYNTKDVLSAYTNGIGHLNLGLRKLKALLNENHDKDIVVYLMSVINIEKKLVLNDRLRSLLQQKIQQYDSRISSDELAEAEQNYLDSALIEDFAELYKNTASTISPRIMVKGSPEHLQVQENANMIRALLLSALRGAAFFRQYGGSRISLATQRKKYLDVTEQLLA